jgi:hypothetical protein
MMSRKNAEWSWPMLAIIAVIFAVALAVMLTTGHGLRTLSVDDSRLPKGSARSNDSLPVTVLRGTIASLDDDSEFKLKRATISLVPDSPQGPQERTVVIGDGTEIFAMIPRSNKEISDAIRKAKEDPANVVPAPYKEIPVTANDLRITMNVLVSADSDIRDSETITAAKIAFYAPVPGKNP